jgi:Mg2+ and Co2+ transporter CorA
VARMEKIFASAFEAQMKRHREGMDNIADAFSANANRMSAQIADAISQMEKSQTALGQNLLKAMNAQTLLITKLHVAMDASNRTIDAALGQSLDALDRSVAVSKGSSVAHADSVRRLAEVTTQLTQTAQTLHSAASMRRRAVREGPGEWILEPVRRLNG